MLNITKFKDYLSECKQEIPYFGKSILVMDDDDFKDYTRNLSRGKDKTVLIGVLIDAGGSGDNEDAVKAVNRLSFFAVQKYDSRATDDENLLVFEVTQDAIKALFDKFLKDSKDFDKRCLATAFDFNRWNITPVKNFHQTNGWELSINLKTDM